MSGITFRRRITGKGAAVAGVAAVALAAAACSSGSTEPGSTAASGGVITVAQITTVSGGYPFGDTIEGTKAYFNWLNEQGGINGLKVNFVSGDDKGQASEASQLARKFVLEDGAAAFVGNTSLADCDTNREFYEANSIAVLGGGTEPNCFSQPNWFPVNTGNYVSHIVQWDYIFNTLKPKTVCALEQNDATSIPAYDQLREWYSTEINPDAHFELVTYTNDASQNPTPQVTAAKEKGCDLIQLSTVAPNAVAFVNAAKTVGLDATFISSGSVYDASVPETLGALGEPGALGPNSQGFFVAAELAMVTDPAADVQQMVTVLDDAGVAANFWSEIGWLSGMVFTNALEQNASGSDLTTAAGVLEALQSMEPYDTGFSGLPFQFGTADMHTGNLVGQIIYIKDGEWQIAPNQNAGDYTEVPALPTLDL